MKLRNSFTEKTRELFVWNPVCFYCGSSGFDALHHILGRVSDSPLNACPIHNFKCHIHNGKLGMFGIKKRLLQKTLKYLLENDYKLTEDKAFKLKYKQYYD